MQLALVRVALPLAALQVSRGTKRDMASDQRQGNTLTVAM